MKSATDARQGRPYHRVRYVLVIGIVLVALGFLATALFTPTPPAP